MKIHPGIKPAMWGAVAGVVALAILGFSQLGWTLGSTAEKMATQRAETAVAAAVFGAMRGATFELKWSERSTRLALSELMQKHLST